MPNLPEIPALDLALGLISALLLLMAAFYLVRARSNAAPGLPPLQRERSGSEGGDLFAEFVPDDTARRLSLVGSLFLHVLLVASLPVLTLLDPGPLLFDMNHYDVVILQYRIPDGPLRLPRDLALANEPVREREQQTPTEREPLGLPDAENEHTQKAQGPLEGPVIEITVGQKEPEPPPLIEVVLQSELPTQMPEAALSLPSVIVWNMEQQRAETLALIRPQRFEMEGQPEAAPGDEPALADLGLADAPAVVQNPALPVPGGSYAPTGEFWRPLDGLGGPPALGFGSGAFSQSGGPWGGDAVSALALQSALQRGPLGQLFGARGGAAWGGSGENVPFRAGANDGPDGGGWGRGRLTPVPRKFHGIILVSNSLSTLPEAVGVLTGNPVYTVYVDVPDAPRKWIVQFCVPQNKGGAVEFDGEVVQVLNRKTMNPPFAVHKDPPKIELLPNLERIAELPPRIVAYATVDAEGNLHGLRIVRGADPQTDSVVLASLRNWEFVPAFRDGQPIEVEALFGIPLY